MILTVTATLVEAAVFAACSAFASSEALNFLVCFFETTSISPEVASGAAPRVAAGEGEDMVW